jgi:hypothetical protein
MKISPDQTVAQVIQQYPETIHTWIALKTNCIGCYLMRFCTLEYVAKSYNIKLEALLEELKQSINHFNKPDNY